MAALSRQSRHRTTEDAEYSYCDIAFYFSRVPIFNPIYRDNKMCIFISGLGEKTGGD